MHPNFSARWLRAVVAAATALLTAAASPAVPELNGVFIVGRDARFRLTESTTKETSGWLRPGDTFAGYVVKEYRADTETLRLVHQRDGSERVLHLREPTIVDSRIAVRGTIRLGPDQTLDVKQATLRWDEETTFPVGPDLTFTVKPSRRPDGNILYHARWERTKSDGTKQLLSAPSVIALPGTAFSAKVGELEFELKP